MPTINQLVREGRKKTVKKSTGSGPLKRNEFSQESSYGHKVSTEERRVHIRKDGNSEKA